MLGVIIAVVIVVAAGVGLLVAFINQKLTELKSDSGVGLIKQDLVSLSHTLNQTQAHMSERLDKAAHVFSGLQHELGKMQELGRSMKDIQDVLKSPKQRGNIGEQLMTDLLRQHIPRSSFQLQYAFRSNEKVDAVIKTKNGLIPIDSKFPAENFLKMVQAESEADKARHRREFESDVKKHILKIAKQYIVPSEGTVDFALMYVPGEAVYYEIMTATDLGEYGAGLRVHLVSPNSFYYFLRTVLLSLEGELIEEKAKEVMTYLRDIQLESRKFGSDLDLAGKHMTNAKAAMDKATSTYAKLGGKIDSANQLTGAKGDEAERMQLPVAANFSLEEEE
jgi:DNA recombination protein RmuC